MKKYHIETMGCQMNERDSETIAGMLEELGFSPTGLPLAETKQGRDAAQIIVVNTCSVRENADNRFFGILGQIKKVKEKHPDTVVAVCGCMMQQQHVVDQIRGKYRWVDIVFGTYNIHEFPRLVTNVLSEQKKVVSVWDDGAEIVEGLPSRRPYPFKAFVNIMYGCNNFCTYCIVPFTRGRERSRNPQDIVGEVAALVKDGVKEVMLLGQNVNSYAGMDEDAQAGGSARVPVSFPQLIRRLDRVEGLERLRFMTSHPKDLSDDLIAAFAECRALCPSIHLPVQSGSNRILEKMNRKYTREQYLSLIEKMRAARPGIAVTTDLIVGFPGETEDDFGGTMDLLEEVRFDSAFTFLYSPRQGTPAAEYAEQVPEDVKHERFNRMVERLNEITLEINRDYVGKTLPVLIDGISKTCETAYAGRTASGKLVNIISSENIEPGKIVDVEITEVNTFSFMGSNVTIHT